MQRRGSAVGQQPSGARPKTPIGALRREWAWWRADRDQPRFRLEPTTTGGPNEPAYPIDMSPLLDLPHGRLDEAGVPYNTHNGGFGGAYQPTTIAQYGLMQWNAYLHDREEWRLAAFLTQARWLVAHATRLTNGADVWPIPFPAPSFGAPGPWLSALTQGNVISALVRAYRVTGEEQFLAVARRGAHAFTVDILDGGVQAPVGANGVFFEEVATYPAARILNGYILALLGLYDYIELTGDAEIAALAAQSVATLHTILSGFDTGYWSRYDLMSNKLASQFYHSLHVTLLQALARATGCAHCAALAERWAAYQRSPLTRARYYVTRRWQSFRARQARRRSAADAATTGRPSRVGVVITAFPVIGGMRSVLFGVEKVMRDDWQMEYLTRRIGSDAQGRVITSFEAPLLPFGLETTSPSQFPNVWFYLWAGARRLTKLARQRRFDLLLPQDGVFTAACTTRGARRLGIPVVTMDHGTVTLPYDETYRRERLDAIRRQPWPKRLLSRLRFGVYLRVTRSLLRRATPRADRFLVAGDEVEELYEKRFGVLPDRIIRYPFMVDTAPFTATDADEIARLRASRDVPADAIVVLLINRLAPEKGLAVAVAGLAQAYARLPEDVRARLRVIIAGSGPLRAEVEAQITRSGLGDVCRLVGEVQPAEAQTLLTIGDVFVYAGNRGTNFSMAVLEAMAAGCAVIATTEPRSNARLLAEGRGLAIPADQATPLAEALTIALTQHERRRQMGQAAQAYVAQAHSAEATRRGLRRATGWAPEIAALTVPAPDAPSPPDSDQVGETSASVAANSRK